MSLRGVKRRGNLLKLSFPRKRESRGEVRGSLTNHGLLRLPLRRNGLANVKAIEDWHSLRRLQIQCNVTTRQLVQPDEYMLVSIVFIRVAHYNAINER